MNLHTPEEFQAAASALADVIGAGCVNADLFVMIAALQTVEMRVLAQMKDIDETAFNVLLEGWRMGVSHIERVVNPQTTH